MKTSIELQSKTKALKAGGKLDTKDRISLLQDIADSLLSMNVRPIDIINTYGVTHNTAITWIQDAYILLERESKYTREGLRAVHKGQIERRLNELNDDLNSGKYDLEDKLKIHDRYIKYLDSRARVTGLNSEVVEHSLQQAPLQIIHADVIDVESIDKA